MTHRYDDGRCAVTIEYEHATVRMIDHVPAGDRPPYVAAGQLTRLPAGVALLSGFAGAISRAHCNILLRALIAEGYRIAYIERLPGHAMPFGARIDAGDFAGLYRVDLARMQDRCRPKTTTAGEAPCSHP